MRYLFTLNSTNENMRYDFYDNRKPLPIFDVINMILT